MPEVKPAKIRVPAAFCYILSSNKTDRSFAVADREFSRAGTFEATTPIGRKLIVAVTRNTTYYALGDVTVCCSWGTRGIDSATGSSFVLASYVHAAPAVVEDEDVQPLTEQLAEFMNDPLHDPMLDETSKFAMCFPHGCVALNWPGRGSPPAEARGAE